jgi:hypothetical protein
MTSYAMVWRKERHRKLPTAFGGILVYNAEFFRIRRKKFSLYPSFGFSWLITAPDTGHGCEEDYRS